MKARPNPFGPPKGSSAPARPFSGSVVGLPSTSTAQPRGMDSPRVRAPMILPCAASLVAMSRCGPTPLVIGTATEMGLVPSTGRPPKGAHIHGSPLHTAMPRNPCDAIRSV